MNVAVAQLAYEGTRAEIAVPPRRASFGLLNEILTNPVSSTAVAQNPAVSLTDWSADHVFGRDVRREVQSANASGVLWLVWSSGSDAEVADPLSVGLTSEAARRAKATAAKTILRQWLEVSPEERAKQNQDLATLVEGLNEERGTGRKFFR